MTTDIGNIKIGVNLIDDYLLTQEAPVASGLTRDLFTVVQNPANASELLTLNGAGDPVHFYPDTTSQSGWSTTTIPVTPPANTGACNRIVGFYHQTVLNALFYYPLTSQSGSAAVWMQAPQPGTWQEATLSATAKNILGYTFQTDQYIDADGNAYLYGISGNYSPNLFFIITYVTAEVNDQLTTQWEPIVGMYPSQFTPAITAPQTAAFRLTEGQSGGSTVTVLWVDGNQISHQDGTITWTEQNGGSSASFAWSGESSTFDPNVGTLTANNLYGIPGDLGSGNLLILDSASTLYRVSDFYAASPSMTALTGGTNQPGSASAVGVGVDSSNIVTLFAIEPGTNYLWYLQQTSTTSLTFGEWVTLGGTLDVLNCPSYMRAGPELFSAGPQSGSSAPAVYHTGQNLSDAGEGTYIWATHKVSAPPDPSNTTPTHTATYSMELQALDAGQNLVNNGTVTVTADQAATVVWNSYGYHIGPNTPLEVELDGAGQATVIYEAVGLTPAVFTCTAYDSSNTVTASRWCRGDVVEYIQSLDGTPLPPLADSVAPKLASVTGSELISASLTGSDYSTTTAADPVAQAINACGQYMEQNVQNTGSVGAAAVHQIPGSQGVVNTSRIKVPHWQIDFSQPGRPRFRVLTETEATEFFAGLPKLDGSSSDPRAAGSWLGTVFGDVAHFFTHEFEQLQTFTASIQNGVLHFVFNDLSFAIATIKQVGAGLETIFTKIRQLADDIYTVVKDVINFLKTLFDWDDILNTHNVIKECVNQTLTNINNSLTAAEWFVDNQFDTLKTEVSTAFDNLESIFGSGQSFNAFVDQTSGSQNTLKATDTQNAHQQHASKCQYVYSRSKPSFSGSSAIALPGLGGGSDQTASITDAVSQNIYSGNTSDTNTGTFNNYTNNLFDFVTNALSDPSALFDLIIVDLLNAAKDLLLFILDGIEDVINAALSIAADAIKALKSALNDTIDIPIITWLWKNVITEGDEFTLLDFISLTCAVPATILYKLIGSILLQPNDPPQAPFSATDLSTLQSNGLPWLGLSSSSSWSSDPSTASGTQLPLLLLSKLRVCSGGLLFFSTEITTTSDYLAYAKSQTGVPQPAIPFLSVLGLIPRLLTFAVGAPVGVFEKATDDWSAADSWTFALWCARGGVLSVDAIFTIFTAAEAKFVPIVGPVLRTAMAAGLLGTGIVAAIYQLPDPAYGAWDAANDIVRPIPGLCKFCLMPELVDASGGVSIGWLGWIDAVAGLGSVATQVGASVYQYEHSN